MKRVSMDALEFDSKIAELSFAEDAETNSELTAKVKKTMAKIIKNDLTPRQREIIMLYYYSGLGCRKLPTSLKLPRQQFPVLLKGQEIKSINT